MSNYKFSVDEITQTVIEIGQDDGSGDEQSKLVLYKSDLDKLIRTLQEYRETL